MNPDDGPTLIAFDGSAAARQAVAVTAALLKPRATLVLTVWEAALAQAAVAPPPDVTMTPAVDPSAMLAIDEALRGHAERVSNDGAELARSLGLDAEPLAMADVRDIARTIAEVARERRAVTIVVGSRGLSGLRARFAQARRSITFGRRSSVTEDADLAAVELDRAVALASAGDPSRRVARVRLARRLPAPDPTPAQGDASPSGGLSR